MVAILGVAESFVITTNLTGDVTHQVPIVAENSNLAYVGVNVENAAYYPQQPTGDHFARQSAGVDMGATPMWPRNEAYQWQTTDQQRQVNGNPTEQFGFFDVIRSLTNVFTGLVGRVNTPTVEYSPMETETPTPIVESEVLLPQHSEEDTMDEDIFEDKAIPPVVDVPISVRLAKVKQLVKSHFAPQTSPNVYDGYPQYTPVEIHDPMSQAPASVVISDEHVSENFGCNSRICLWKK